MTTWYGTAQRASVGAPDGGVYQVPLLSMVIYNPVEERASTSIQVTVGGCDPGAQLIFTLDGIGVWTTHADAQGNLDLTAIPVNETFGAGPHTLTVTSGLNGTDSGTFALIKDGTAFPVDQTVDVDPVLVPGSTGRWVFQDLLPGGLGSWIMPLNPVQMSNPEFVRTVSDQHTTAPITGRFHFSEPFITVPAWKVSGYCPNQAFHDQLQAYADLRRRIYVIDHRGRAWTCVVLGYALESRKRKANDDGTWNDWTGNYTLDLEILDQEWKTPA